MSGYHKSQPKVIESVMRDIEARMAAHAHASASADDALELELRSGDLPVDYFERHLSFFEGAPLEVSFSIIIARGQRNTRDHIVVRRVAGANEPTCMRKAQLLPQTPTRIDGWKVTLSRETRMHAGDPAPAADDIVRIRVRVSRVIEQAGLRWSVDMTLVRQIAYGDFVAERKRDDILPRIVSASASASVAKIIEIMRPTKCEVEVEYVSAVGVAYATPTLADVRAVVDMLAIAGFGGASADAAAQQHAQQHAQQGSTDAAAAQHTQLRTQLLQIAQRAIGDVAHRELTLKRMLNNAMGLSVESYKRLHPPLIGYYVCDKTDGVRALCFVYSDGAIAVVTETDVLWNNASRSDASRSDVITIYDCEYVAQVNTAFAFDCLMYEGKSVCAQPFSERVTMLGALQSGATSVAPKHFEVMSAQNIREVCTQIMEAKYPYSIDGLILTSPNDDYANTRNLKWKPAHDMTIDFLCVRCPRELRGKYMFEMSNVRGDTHALQQYVLFVTCSPEQMRLFCIERESNEIIDRLAHSEDQEVATLARRLMHARRGALLNVPFICRFNPRAFVLNCDRADLHGKVVECRASASQSDVQWEIMRVRDDRTAGNNINTATDVFTNYVAPFEMRYLWEPAESYFSASQTYEAGGGAISAGNKYRRFILLHQFMSVFGARRENYMPRVLDIGGGMAQDYIRYLLCGVRFVANIDKDPFAIAASTIRINTGLRDLRRNPAGSRVVDHMKHIDRRGAALYLDRAKNSCVEYYARAADIAQYSGIAAWRALLASVNVGEKSVTHVVSTFAFHYLCDSEDRIAEFFAMCAHALAKDGQIIISTMSAARVRDALRSASADAEQKLVVEYRGANETHIIEAQRPHDAMHLITSVRVSLPFSKELVAEPLCDFERVHAIAQTKGFTLLREVPFDRNAFAKSFAKCNPELGAKLDDAELAYTELFSTLIFARKRIA